jgi:hypothetical protein
LQFFKTFRANELNRACAVFSHRARCIA